MSNGWKHEIENYRRLSMSNLWKSGILNHYGQWIVGWGDEEDRPSIQIISDPEEEKITLDYRYKNGDDWTPTRYLVNLSRIPCNLGGYRLYFLCPNCGQRVLNLYLVNYKFTCRHCNNFTYKTRNETRGKMHLWSRWFDYGNKADKLYKDRRWQTHYNNQPTKRYRRYAWYQNISELYGMKILKQR